MKVNEHYKSIDETIRRVAKSFPEDSRIPQIFQTCISDTLQKTIKIMEDGRVFVITGDIPAMWLRDSSCQLHLFLRFAKDEPQIREIIRGLIANQVRCILIDPYANAFNEEANGNCWSHDKTDMKPELWERKYEIDSLCYPVQLSYLYWKETGDASVFTEEWKKAAKTIITTFRTEQDHENKSAYMFERPDADMLDTLSRDGKGALVKPNIGLIFSGFRPSDDSCVYGYLIPSNMFASVILGYISEIASEVYGDAELCREAFAFSKEVRDAIEKYAVVPAARCLDLDEMMETAKRRMEGDARPGDFMYVYEVDGFGKYLVMDDANVPSLLAMPYYGYCAKDDPKYLCTRKVLLSDANPYYYSGTALRGIGSPHTPRDYVWDISLAIQGLTSTDMEEKKMLLRMMAENDNGTNMMHEGINVNDPSKYTRPWFSWANSMFCELVLDVCDL
jgi:meiotically up-regulated gene 157 (Mug157) protein